MQVPIQISYRNLDPSESLDRQIHQRAEELEQFFGRIISCRVMVELVHRRQHQGRLFHIRLDLRIPGSEIVIKRDPPQNHAHEDAHVAIRDAFDAARRQLEDKARQKRADTKTHEPSATGRVSALMCESDYGFLLDRDGQEIYFHRNSVPHGAFDRLQIGDEVRFVVHPGEGEKGPQASTVIATGRRARPAPSQQPASSTSSGAE